MQEFVMRMCPYRLLILISALFFASVPVAQATWLDDLNYYREMANIQPVTENAAWSGWCWKHSRYVVKNDAWGHFENPGLPWYTPEGDYAARHSNLTYGSRLTLLDKEMIQAWMKGPFHALGMIDPKLLQVGFASYREDIGTTKAVGTLDVLSGRGPIPPSVSYPVMWPANGKTVDLRSYHGLERPDPLTSSPGYTAPTGLPITLQIGPGNVLVNVSGSSFSVGGASLEHFTIDETDYYNPNAEVQAQERASLNSRDAIILIPKKPLAEGHEYAASITANGTTYRWSFKVKETKKPAVKLDAPFVSTKTSKRPTFRISWKATDPYPSSGIHSYTVRYRPANSRDWMNWKVNTTSTYGYFKGAAGRTYYFRVRVKDNDGNYGWSKVMKTIVPYNEGANIRKKIGFNGYYKRGKSSNYLTSVRYSYKRGHTLVYRLDNTNGIGLVTTKSSNRGRAKIYVDGKYFKTVDAHSSKHKPRQLIFYKGFKKKGTHFLKIINKGTPGRTRFDVDAIVAGR